MYAQVEKSNENKRSAVAHSVAQKKSTGNPISLADNREQPIQFAKFIRDEFNSNQKKRALAKNKAKHMGFHTCTNCGFQHTLVNYATRKGKKTGDGGFQIDHIKPASKGGRAIMSNAAVLCGTCNTSKGNRAVIKSTGKKKYAGLHRKTIIKDYKVKRKGY